MAFIIPCLTLLQKLGVEMNQGPLKGGMYSFPEAAITNYCKLGSGGGDKNNNNLLFHSSGDQRFKLKVLAAGPSEGSEGESFLCLSPASVALAMKMVT